jgi:hypothetical protein
MAMELVNGIPCFNCTDVERAKKVGLDGSANVQDPLHPSAVPQGNGGAGTSSSPADAANQVLGINQPLTSGDRGTQLNLLL